MLWDSKNLAFRHIGHRWKYKPCYSKETKIKKTKETKISESIISSNQHPNEQGLTPDNQT